MADGLSEQQAIATEIPYKNIAANTNAVDGFINAWSMATQIKLKRQELEGKMAALVARNRQLEINDDLREKQFGMRMEQWQAGHGLALEKLDFERQKAAAGEDIAYKRWGLASDAAEAKHQKDVDRMDAQAGLAHVETQLAAEGKQRGDEGWDAEYMKRAEPYLRMLNPSEWNAVHKDVATGQNAAIKMRTANFNTRFDSWKRDYGSSVFGTPQIQNTSVLDNIDALKDETTTTGIWPFSTTTKTGKKLIPGYDAAKGTAAAIPKTVSELNKWKKEYQAFMDEKQHIPPPRDVPEVGVYANPAATKKERAQRALSDPEATEAEKAQARKILSGQ